MNPYFSLLCPSRGRYNETIRLIDSIIKTAKDISQIELLILYDKEDNTKKIDKNTYEGQLNIKILQRTHSDYLNRDYYNWLANLSKGRLIWAIGDDVIFESDNWDYIIRNSVEKYIENHIDGVLYIETDDGTEAKHCCFPIITREAFNIMGFFLHPDLLTWGADRTIYEIYGNPKINRVLKIPNIRLNHISYHDGKVPPDETAKSVKERFFRDCNCHNKISENLIPKQVEYLYNYLEGIILNERMEE